MILRHIFVACDNCDAETGPHLYRTDARKEARKMGWLHIKPDVDLCPDCVRKRGRVVVDGDRVVLALRTPSKNS